MRREQERALRYLRRRGTEARADDVRRRLADTYGEMERCLGEVEPARSGVRPGPGRWSVLEIVDHLVESNRPAVAELRSLLAGESPQDGPIPAGLVSEDPSSRSFEEHRYALAETHAQLLDVFSAASDETPLTGRAPIVMVIKAKNDQGETEVLEWVEALDWKAYAAALRVHTYEHVQQVRRTLEELGDQPMG